MKMRHLKLFQLVFSVTVASLIATAAPARAEDLNLTLAGASPGGLWTLLAAGIDSALKVDSKGSSITYQTSGGGFANAIMVSQGRAEIGLIHDAELSIAAEGGKPFREPMIKLRTIGYLYDWAPMQFIANKSFADDKGVNSLDDLKKVSVRVAINRAGNITGLVAEAMLRAAGVSEANIDSLGGALIRAGSKEQADLLLNGRVDLYANGVFVGHSSIRKTENSMDIKLLKVSEDVIEKVAKQFSIGSFTIPANSYKNQPEPIKTLRLGAVLVASDAMSEKDAYQLTKAMIDNLSVIQSMHPAMAKLSHELMSRKTPVPFHDGALRAYREAGLIK